MKTKSLALVIFFSCYLYSVGLTKDKAVSLKKNKKLSFIKFGDFKKVFLTEKKKV